MLFLSLHSTKPHYGILSEAGRGAGGHLLNRHVSSSTMYSVSCWSCFMPAVPPRSLDAAGPVPATEHGTRGEKDAGDGQRRAAGSGNHRQLGRQTCRLAPSSQQHLAHLQTHNTHTDTHTHTHTHMHERCSSVAYAVDTARATRSTRTTYTTCRQARTS
jgi:hypothetical protein